MAQGDQSPVRTDNERQPPVRANAERRAVVLRSQLLIIVLPAGTAIVPWRILRSPRT